MQYILLIIFSLIFIWLSWKKPIWAIALIVLALPAYTIRFQLLSVPFTLLEVMIWLCFLTYFIKWAKTKHELKGKKIPRTGFPFRWLILLWLLASIVAVIISPDLRTAMGLWKAYFLEPAMFFILFIAHVRTKKDLHFIFYFLGISALIISSIAIYQKFTGWMIPNEFWAAEETRRVTSVFGYPNAIGLYLGPIIMLYFGWLWTSIKKLGPSIFKLIVIIASFLAVYFAVSEAALIGLAVGLIVFGLVYNKKSRIITLAIIVIAILLIGFNQPLRQDLQDKVLLHDFSGQIRRHMWVDTGFMLEDNTLTGAGLAGYQTAMEPYHRELIWIGKTLQPVELYLYPHNIFLNFWSELGMLGLAVFMIILVKYFYLAIRNLRSRDQEIERSTDSPIHRSLSLSLLCLMLALIVHGLVDAPYFKNDLAVMFWLFTGMVTVIHINKEVVGKR